MCAGEEEEVVLVVVPPTTPAISHSLDRGLCVNVYVFVMCALYVLYMYMRDKRAGCVFGGFDEACSEVMRVIVYDAFLYLQCVMWGIVYLICSREWVVVFVGLVNHVDPDHQFVTAHALTRAQLSIVDV